MRARLENAYAASLDLQIDLQTATGRSAGFVADPNTLELTRSVLTNLLAAVDTLRRESAGSREKGA